MSDTTEPVYALSEPKNKVGYVKIKVHLKGLEVSSIENALSKAKAKNADVKITFGDSNFDLTVSPHLEDKKMNGAHYSLVKNDWIRVFLKKKDVSISWEYEIRTGQIASTG
ncbi:uncharacterized protein LOC129926271 isoform X2 [Biomphalaria glabrata]|uniref:Uncharacterized protein LOC129926271 isoform X2 n=1 Tax=Biomphalaria glabrata TaxID=6526 RepID=A0A9W3ADJ2_BIOGL|nr:uncharacterized protein LOC129926271 isoform X2 [Biomphalaria glabrata]